MKINIKIRSLLFIFLLLFGIKNAFSNNNKNDAGEIIERFITTQLAPIITPNQNIKPSPQTKPTHEIEKPTEIPHKRRLNKDSIEAVENNRPELVRQYLINGASVNFTIDRGWTALMIAAYNDYYYVAKILLRNGADINMKNKSGSTALSLAFERNQYEVAKLLLNNGANPYEGSYGKTAINEAHKQNNHKMLSLLKRYLRK